MSHLRHVHRFRVRYYDIDQMGTYYNARALEWFEIGRTELCRTLGKSYRQWEADGVALPVVIAHVEYQGKASYDDELTMTTVAAMAGRVRMRFDMQIENSQTAPRSVAGTRFTRSPIFPAVRSARRSGCGN